MQIIFGTCYEYGSFYFYCSMMRKQQAIHPDDEYICCQYILLVHSLFVVEVFDITS